MPRLDTRFLRKRFLESGLSPRQVRRTIAELEDHFDDLYDDAMASGMSAAAAEKIAMQQLGDMDSLIAAVRARPELRSWAYRFPLIAMFVYPLACVIALPAMPVIIGFSRAEQVARWAACFVASAIVTATLLLLMLLAITLT